MLIEQMQQALNQLVQHEAQTTLSDIPVEQLMRVLILRFPLDPLSPEMRLLIEQFSHVISQYLPEMSLEVTDIPDHVPISWIINKLEIRRSTFYKSVNNILLFPVLKVGRRPYYLKADVIDLFDKTRGMGPHILGKLAGKTRKE